MSSDSIDFVTKFCPPFGRLCSNLNNAHTHTSHTPWFQAKIQEIQPQRYRNYNYVDL